MNARPRHHHYLIHTTTPPICTVPRWCFTRRARKRATAAWFQTQTRSLPRILQTHDPTTTTTSSAPLPHLPSLLFTSISDGVPSIELQWLGFRFLALNLINL